MAAGDDDERVREARKLDEDTKARLARLKNTSGATLATRPNQVVNTPIGPRTPGPVPSNLPARISPDGIDRAAYLYQDRQRFRDGSGPTKILVSHDPYQEHPPRNDGRAQCSFHLSTDEGIHEIPVGSTVNVRLPGKVVIEFLTTEPAVVRPGADAIVGGLARHPGADGNIDIHCRAGLTGFPKVTVDNPFPGMSGADIAPDGALILRRPVRPRMDALFEDPFSFAEGKRDPSMDAENTKDGPKDLVRANLERLRLVVQPEDMGMIRKWTTADGWRAGVSVQSFVANLSKAGLVLCIERSTGDVLLGMGFTNGVMTESHYDDLPTKKLPLPR